MLTVSGVPLSPYTVCTNFSYLSSLPVEIFFQLIRFVFVRVWCGCGVKSFFPEIVPTLPDYPRTGVRISDDTLEDLRQQIQQARFAQAPKGNAQSKAQRQNHYGHCHLQLTHHLGDTRHHVNACGDGRRCDRHIVCAGFSQSLQCFGVLLRLIHHQMDKPHEVTDVLGVDGLRDGLDGGGLGDGLVCGNRVSPHRHYAAQNHQKSHQQSHPFATHSQFQR